MKSLVKKIGIFLLAGVYMGIVAATYGIMIVILGLLIRVMFEIGKYGYHLLD